MRRRETFPYFFLLPALVILIFLQVYPISYELFLSVQQKVAGTYQFIGIKNFVDLFSSYLFWHSLKVTIIYSIGSVSIAFIWGFILALLVNEKVKGRIFFRTLLLLPWALPLVTVSLNFRWIFHERVGLANYLLSSILGAEFIPWLSNEIWATVTAIFVNAWKIAPFGMIMILGALQSIPQVLYEAAEIDGATSWYKFIHITLPLSRGAISTVILMEIIWSFCSFTILFLLTEGGPLNATLTLPLYIYRLGFKEGDFGLAASASTVLLLIMSVITIIYLKFIKKVGETL